MLEKFVLALATLAVSCPTQYATPDSPPTATATTAPAPKPTPKDPQTCGGQPCGPGVPTTVPPFLQMTKPTGAQMHALIGCDKHADTCAR